MERTIPDGNTRSEPARQRITREELRVIKKKAKEGDRQAKDIMGRVVYASDTRAKEHAVAARRAKNRKAKKSRRKNR